MIKYKSEREIELMRAAGRIVAGALKIVKETVQPGITTIEIDRRVEEYVLGNKAELAFKGYRGYPGNICISINEEVVHGIPGKRRLNEGDIVSIDVGVRYKNYYADAAFSLPVGKVSENARRLLEIGKETLEIAIDNVNSETALSRVSGSIQKFVESKGFNVVRNFVGHGIGANLHEEPQIPNYIIDPPDNPEVILKPGMALAIEPMVNEGTWEVETLPNGWTVVTKDKKLSVHFEHTVAVVPDGKEILTRE